MYRYVLNNNVKTEYWNENSTYENEADAYQLIDNNENKNLKIVMNIFVLDQNLKSPSIVKMEAIIAE